LNQNAERFSAGRREVLGRSSEERFKRVGGGQDGLGNICATLGGQLRSQHILKIVRKLAQLAHADGGGISLERVDHTANAADRFFSARAPLERQPVLIQRLEQLMRGLKEELAQVAGTLIERLAHAVSSIRS
jgi:hypothetical protein